MKKSRFNPGDIIGFDGKKGYCYCRVLQRSPHFLLCEDLEGDGDIFTVEETEMDYYPAVYPSENKLKKFASYEISWQNFVGKTYPAERLRVKEKRGISLDELERVLDKAGSAAPEVFRQEWQEPMHRYGHDLYRLDETEFEEGHPVYRGLPSDEALTARLAEKIARQSGEPEAISSLKQELARLKAMLEKPVPLRSYPERDRESYLRYYLGKKVMEEAEDKEVLLYTIYCDELCAAHNLTAMDAKARALGGGSRAYACDWSKARELFVELLRETGDVEYANRIGKIYYDGSADRGRSNYEKAFHYFSIGAAGLLKESLLRQADLLRDGKGVDPNPQIALNITETLYHNEKKLFEKDGPLCFLPEAALRMAQLQRRGVGVPVNADEAFRYLLEADYALSERKKVLDTENDEETEKSLRLAMKAVLPNTRYKIPEKGLQVRLDQIIPQSEGVLYSMTLTEASQGKAEAVIVPVGIEDEEIVDKEVLLTVPAAHYCALTDEIRLKASSVKNFRIYQDLDEDEDWDEEDDWDDDGPEEEDEEEGRAADLPEKLFFNSIDGNELYLMGELVADLEGIWHWTVPKQ